MNPKWSSFFFVVLDSSRLPIHFFLLHWTFGSQKRFIYFAYGHLL
nr:MAG TPA: hypothetical protein [Caudoviricetes sp.]